MAGSERVDPKGYLCKQESVSPYLLSCVCLLLTKSRLILSGLFAAFLVRHFTFDHLARCS
jgi:hypothetical protein